jgi:hypothetical protein
VVTGEHPKTKLIQGYRPDTKRKKKERKHSGFYTALPNTKHNNTFKNESEPYGVALL